MLTRRVIPCLDCREGRVVKGVRFADLRDVGSPAACAAAYEVQGADEIVLLDVSATTEGRGHHLGTVRAVRAELSIPLTVGGGVRDVASALALLEAGADKVAVNTAAVHDPVLITRLSDCFGRQCVVLAVDAVRDGSGGWRVVVGSGRQCTGHDAVSWCGDGVHRGAGEILLTSWDRDGTRAGFELDLIKAVSEAVSVPIIASGGAANPAHLLEALRAGADAVLAASMFHEGDYSVADVKRCLAENAIQVRP